MWSGAACSRFAQRDTRSATAIFKSKHTHTLLVRGNKCIYAIVCGATNISRLKPLCARALYASCLVPDRECDAALYTIYMRDGFCIARERARIKCQRLYIVTYDVDAHPNE